MARYVLASILVLLASSTGLTAYAAESTKTDEQAVLSIEQAWNDAIKTKNRTFFEKHLSEDFIYGDDEGGLTKGRAAYIDVIMKGPKVLEQSGTDEAVKVHGSTAVGTGRVSVKNEKNESFSIRYMDTYVKGADGWKAIASQETEVK